DQHLRLRGHDPGLGRDFPVLEGTHLALPGEVDLGGPALALAAYPGGEEPRLDQEVEVGTGDVGMQGELVGNLLGRQGTRRQEVREDGRARRESEGFCSFDRLVISDGHTASIPTFAILARGKV